MSDSDSPETVEDVMADFSSVVRHAMVLESARNGDHEAQLALDKQYTLEREFPGPKENAIESADVYISDYDEIAIDAEMEYIGPVDGDVDLHEIHIHVNGGDN